MILTNQFGTLLKFQIKYKLGLRRIKEFLGTAKYGKAAAAGGILLFLVIIACILVPYIFLMNILYDSFAANGNLRGYFDTLFLLSNFIAFITALLSSYGILFSGRDREILAPLPFNETIYFSDKLYHVICGRADGVARLSSAGIYPIRNQSGIFFFVLIKALIGASCFPARRWRLLSCSCRRCLPQRPDFAIKSFSLRCSAWF